MPTPRVALLAALLLGFPLVACKKQSDGSKDVVCTMDAKMCPDGSAVGRQGPNCEFAPCPTSGSTGSSEGEPVGCTKDAKVCPDGSSVGRVGPDCEFAPCPGE